MVLNSMQTEQFLITVEDSSPKYIGQHEREAEAEACGIRVQNVAHIKYM